MSMFLGHELVKGPLRRLDREAMAAETQTLLDELDVRIDSREKHGERVGIRRTSETTGDEIVAMITG